MTPATRNKAASDAKAQAEATKHILALAGLKETDDIIFVLNENKVTERGIAFICRANKDTIARLTANRTTGTGPDTKPEDVVINAAELMQLEDAIKFFLFMQATNVNPLTPEDIGSFNADDFLVYGAFPVDSKGQPAPGQDERYVHRH